MKLHLKVSVLVIILIYLGCSFVKFDFNPSNWLEEDRGACMGVMLSFLISVNVIIAMANDSNKKN